MLFNSYEFILAFLPLCLAVFFFIASRFGHEPAIGWLVLASLFFYGWWNPVYLLLIVASMGFNYGIGRLLCNGYDGRSGITRRLMLIIGVVFNLVLLGYFKYANFFVDNLNLLADSSFNLEHIVLPLAISFFTFQQITYLVDSYQGETHEYKLLHYGLFVTFFPQLIAGPIVHHREMMPQFMQRENLRPQMQNLVVGLTIFSFGLFKKVVLADGVAQYASPVFAAAEAGEALSFFVAWGGALAYTMQLYFDFSGYSDMAIGIARMFGVRLPLNFHSPYKAANIIEFWRRWHMTLSRFLRDYVYIPLGGNRKGRARRHANLMITMLLGGLWHGAGWTFVIWGGLHGLYLVINHAWRHMVKMSGLDLGRGVTGLLWGCVAWLITFIAVVVGWVFFRATTFEGAMQVIHGMAGMNGISIPNAIAVHLGGVAGLLTDMGVGVYLGGGADFVFTYSWVLLLLLVSLWMPNTQELMVKAEPAYNSYQESVRGALPGSGVMARRLTWSPGKRWVILVSVVFASAFLSLTQISEFLYFQF